MMLNGHLVGISLALTGCAANFNSSFVQQTSQTPSISITGPAANSVSQSGATIAGTCRDGLPITLSGSGLASPSSTTCSGGTFSQAITFTAGNGSKAITISQTDAAGNTGSANSTFVRGTLYVSNDSSLNTGNPTSLNYTAPGSSSNIVLVSSTANSGQNWWIMFTDPWGLNSGSGSINMGYSGTGALTIAANLTGLTGYVNAYPFIGFGADPYGYHNGNQPIQFPAQLSSMAYLNFEVTYTVFGSPAGLVDVLFDEWLIPNSTYSSGPAGAIEVEIMPYCTPGYPPGTFVKNFTANVVLNGAATTMMFAEYKTGTGAGSDVLFFPQNAPGLSSGNLRFNALDFFNEAVASAAINSSWWIAGLNFGTELGGSGTGSSTQNYTLTINKMLVEQMIIGP